MFNWTELDTSCRLLCVPMMEETAKFMRHSNKKVMQKQNASGSLWLHVAINGMMCVQTGFQ